MNLNVREWLLPYRSNVYRTFRVEFSSFAFSQGDAHFGRNYYTKQRTWSVGQVFDTQRLNHAIATAAESWLEHASPTVAVAVATRVCCKHWTRTHHIVTQMFHFRVIWPHYLWQTFFDQFVVLCCSDLLDSISQCGIFLGFHRFSQLFIMEYVIPSKFCRFNRRLVLFLCLSSRVILMVTVTWHTDPNLFFYTLSRVWYRKLPYLPCGRKTYCVTLSSSWRKQCFVLTLRNSLPAQDVSQHNDIVHVNFLLNFPMFLDHIPLVNHVYYCTSYWGILKLDDGYLK